ncbi:DAK2 domain-containing protein [Dietzia sp.]|uniref:DAK2 domain-containing protein n=1 Tax=Dietzia sp. TaxID=1871616 RepID=UPI002FDB1E10
MVQVDSAHAGAAPGPRGTLDVLDGPAALDWARRAADALRAAKDEINGLNVFPVPDSDTGTNMVHTMGAAVASAERAAKGTGESGSAAPSAQEIAAALARGAIREARGNSGVILSQVLRAIATHTGAEGVTAETIGLGLRTAVSIAGEALSTPVEGTIITVLRESAEAAEDTDIADTGLAGVAIAAADAACAALERTPELLDVLREAGVVDAGGRGLLVLLDTLVAVVTGETPERPTFAPKSEPTSTSASMPASGAASQPRSSFETYPKPGNSRSVGGRHGPEPAAGTGESGPGGSLASTAKADEQPVDGREVDAEAVTRFEVMYSLRGMESPEGGMLREELQNLGDSVIVATDGARGAEAYWSIHVHTNDIGAAIEAGIGLGELAEIRVEDLFGPPEPGADEATDPGRAVVALVEPGPIAGLFEEAGAVAVDSTVTEPEIIRALLDVAYSEIIVLSNGALGHELMAAIDDELVAHGRHCILLPTQSVVQGLAALAVHDPDSSLSIDGFDMSDAAAATRYARLDRASKRALTLVGPCAAGDIVGVIGHDVAVVESDPAAAFAAVVDQLLAVAGEMLTIFAAPEIRDIVEAEITRLSERFPDLEIVLYDAGAGDVLAYVGLE